MNDYFLIKECEQSIILFQFVSQISKMIFILQIVYQILSIYLSRLILNIDFSRH